MSVSTLRTVPPSCALSTIVLYLLQSHLEKVLERPGRAVQDRKPLCRREVSATLTTLLCSPYVTSKPVPVAARSNAWVCGLSPAKKNPTVATDVCRECYVLSGRGLCDGLITRPEESYRLWCVVVCDLGTS